MINEDIEVIQEFISKYVLHFMFYIIIALYQ